MMKKLFPNVIRANLEKISNEQKKMALKKQSNKCFYTKEPLDKKGAYFVVLDDNVVACSKFAYYCLNINLVDLDNQGKLVLIPELSQEELYYLLKNIWVSELIEDKYDEQKEVFPVVEDFLRERSDALNKVYNQLMSDVNFYIQLIMAFDDNQKNNLDKGFYGLRWMPDKSLFEEDIALWAKEVDIIKNPPKWKRFYLDLKKKINSKK